MTNGGQFPATQLHKYPHFFPLDIPIWERFLNSVGNDFLSFDYDVKVGSGTEPAEGVGDSYARMQRILSRYRIDAVGHRSGSICIIEVKPEAGTIAVGQTELYRELYLRDYTPSLPVTRAIITDRELPDMRYYCDLKGVELHVV